MSTSFTQTVDYNELINCILKYVPLKGWTIEAVSLGAKDAKADIQDTLAFFNHDMDNAIAYYSDMLDQQMVKMLESYPLADMKIRERIALIIMTRFELMAPHREAVKRTTSYLCLPSKLSLASRLLYKTVSIMWYSAGDTATDFNFYTKRGLLASVYSTALIYWLNDQSLGFIETRAFVDRRINNVMIIPMLKSHIKKVCTTLLKPFGI